ncbi:MAG TPA: hypothetical protein VFI46_18295 [Jiangellaceae bacterium]|nr:hypothetical protein [Jiangellaceae bacterium]
MDEFDQAVGRAQALGSGAADDAAQPPPPATAPTATIQGPELRAQGPAH